MFDELINKLLSILEQIEDSELEDIIQSLKESNCSNGMFCGVVWIRNFKKIRRFQNLVDMYGK